MQTRLNLNPYITFPGTAREAMAFYRDVFGGTLTLRTYAEFGMAEGDAGEQIVHAVLETDAGFTLMGADASAGVHIPEGTNVAISLSGDRGEQLLDYWHRLSDGGTVRAPLASQVWGDEYGVCTDRYGTVWKVDIAQPQL